MSEEWGPWIEHDGAGVQVGHDLEMMIKVIGDGFRPPREIDPTWPGFFWRWRRVRIGWFRREWRRVCDDPRYAPIVAYRFLRPRGSDAAVEALREIARMEREPERETA